MDPKYELKEGRRLGAKNRKTTNGAFGGQSRAKRKAQMAEHPLLRALMAGAAQQPTKPEVK